MKNRVTVNIYGRSYPMTTDESPEYTEKLAEALNGRLEKLREQKKTLSVQDAAAIISLECLDELVKKKQTEHNIRTQISAYAEDASDSRAEIERLNKQITRLNERIRQLESEIKLRQQFAEEDTAAQMVKSDIDRALGNQTVKPATSAQAAQTSPARPAAAAAAAPRVTPPLSERPAAQTAPRTTLPISERAAAQNAQQKNNK